MYAQSVVFSCTHGNIKGKNMNDRVILILISIILRSITLFVNLFQLPTIKKLFSIGSGRSSMAFKKFLTEHISKAAVGTIYTCPRN